MEFKLFGVYVVGKGTEKIRSNLKHLNANLSYPDKSWPESTRLSRKPQTITLNIWAQNFWLMSFFVHSLLIQDIIYKKTIPKRCDCSKISRCCDKNGARYIHQSDWNEIHTLMRWFDWCEQHTAVYANIELFSFWKKKKKKKLQKGWLG